MNVRYQDKKKKEKEKKRSRMWTCNTIIYKKYSSPFKPGFQFFSVLVQFGEKWS